jgi:SAM-dependent methyltransferase
LRCRSVFVKSRPHVADLQRYYSSSPASRLRIEYFIDETAAARTQHIIQSRVDWIDQVVGRIGEGLSLRVADLGTLYPGLFSELRTLKAVAHLHSVGADHEVRPKLGADVMISGLEPGSADAVTAFEQLEHQADPRQYMADIGRMLRPGGHLFLTTRTISGFDLQMLWDQAPYIFVPEHLNLLSVEGLSQLVEDSGLELVELSTPGQLDVALVRETLDADPAIRIPRFADYLLRSRGDEAHEDLQAYLQKHRLSSHVRIVARR